MLIAFKLPKGDIKVYDTAEVPAVYILTVAEAANIARVHLSNEGTGKANRAFHMSLDDRKAIEFANPIYAAAQQQRMVEAIGARPSARMYFEDRYSSTDAAPAAKIIEGGG